MAPPSGNLCEEAWGRRALAITIISPAGHGAVSLYVAGMVLPSGNLCEEDVYGRRAFAISIISPAGHGAVSLYAAGMAPPSGNLCVTNRRNHCQNCSEQSIYLCLVVVLGHITLGPVVYGSGSAVRTAYGRTAVIL